MSADGNRGWHPKFGDAVENTVAGQGNPRRVGTFVRVVRRTGRLNPGMWWEVTDRFGDFWLSNPEHCRPVESPDCTCIPYHLIGCSQYAESWKRRASQPSPVIVTGR